MLRFFRSPNVEGPLSVILIFSFLTMMSGCSYFRVSKSQEPPHQAVVKLQGMGKLMILHFNDKIWQFVDIIATPDTISGSILPIVGHERYKTAHTDRVNRYKASGAANEQYITSEVHIYATGLSQTSGNKVAIPTGEIDRIEVYDPATGANIASFVFGASAVAMAAFGLILIIAALTKSSCPFVYSDNGSDFLFTGEIFSGATQPGLERDDYLPLPKLRSDGGSYKIRLTNEVNEVQSVNSAGIIVADHPENTSVLIDKIGVIHSVGNISRPVRATNNSGSDVLPFIASKDSLSYSGDMKDQNSSGIEDIYLKFKRPDNSGSSKLIIRAKNTFWLDVLFSKFHGLFGSKYDEFVSKQESSPPEKLKKFLLDQNIPLSVYCEKDGKWEFADYFNIAGPMAFKDDILTIDLPALKSDTVSLKLETGFLFWELDFAGMDFSKDEKIITYSLAPDEAIMGNGDDVSSLVSSRDKSYLVLDDIGDNVSLTFAEPLQQSSDRSVFLHTSGFYKIIRDQRGPANVKALKTFKRPNRFPRFSREMYEQALGN
jgi:hypothetical protein